MGGQVAGVQPLHVCLDQGSGGAILIPHLQAGWCNVQARQLVQQAVDSRHDVAMSDKKVRATEMPQTVRVHTSRQLLWSGYGAGVV